MKDGRARGPRRPYAPRVPDAVRRDQLLDAALRLIVRSGHGSATMDNVASEAKVTKPVVYSFYGNRAELLAALLKREQQHALAQMLAILPPGAGDDGISNWRTATAVLLTDFLAAVAQSPDRWACVLLNVPGMPPEFDVARTTIRQRVVARIARIVVATAAKSGTEVLIDSEIIAESVLALFEMAARLTINDPGGYPAERFTTTLAQVFSSIPNRSPAH
ncbi:TetR/AcrR family transcriptional regulator [Rhodococcus erythropolis]|uniref:TetR/AcrR family transcriptional regulator n=1 Tax=Rhodococcus erythropolis TaxID=1833 RepID=UPI002109A53F|nr:TetR/AcrR family transcriptional regulator [Rhodococcus erythropolis]MCQ4129235.1 TetR/AcrR family transcriptional regulator [Rhodococcus erythropolis]